MPDPCRTLHGFLTDGAILIVNADVDVRGRPYLRGSRNDRNRVKKVPRDIHSANGDGDCDRHAGWGAHILTKQSERKIHVALVGRYDVGAVLSIQEANNLVEVFLGLKELGENVQDIARVVLHLSFVTRCL
jgi:hypothetical protein